MYGFGTAVVNDKLQLCECEFYYDAKNFLDAMEGKIPASHTGASTIVGSGCPRFQAAAAAAKFQGSETGAKHQKAASHTGVSTIVGSARGCPRFQAAAA